jgi:hypothetical protein
MNRGITVYANPSFNDSAYDSFCPRILEPFSDCHCVNITSQEIALMLEFCGGNYQGCEIYNRCCPVKKVHCL